MLGDARLVAFVASRDLAVSDRFYGGVLALKRMQSSAFANAYECNGVSLRVTLVETLTPAPYTVLGWRVADIGTAIETLAGRGVRFLRYRALAQDPRGVWLAPGGSRVAWFADPDGNTLSLQQEPAPGAPA